MSGSKGERRLLSLLFADLAGSGELADVLDPEDLREVYRQTREIACAAVTKYGGRVKDFFGDGVLAYFGYPVAVERGAQAAVNAGLEMVAAVAQRRWPLVEQAGHTLRMRVGIHTGEVVIADIGMHEIDAVVGAAPIVASRVQTAAAPNTVVISAATHELVAGEFRCRDLGAVSLKSVAEPMQLFVVEAPGSVRAQVERIATRHLRPLAGRAEELRRLRAAWQVASEGGRAAVCVRGEAGIGKSRLLAELKATIRASGRGRVWEFQCSPHHVATPFFAVASMLAQVFEFSESDSADERLGKARAVLHRCALTEPEHEWLVAELLGLPFAEAELAATLAPEARQPRRLALLSGLMAALCEDAALFEINDAHWIDASTADWLAHFRREQPGGAMLALTARPDAPASDALSDGMEVIQLAGLPEGDIEALARSVVGGRIVPHELVAHLARTCGGVPLFVEELTAALLASGVLRALDDRCELQDWSPARQLPVTLRDLLQSRLDQLAPELRAVVQVCAVIGGEANARIVSRVLDDADLASTEAALESLTDAGFLHRTASGCAIRHALIENAAYESLLKSARTRYHVRVAELLRDGGFDGVRAEPALIAQHFTLAGLLGDAAPLWLQAAQFALRRSALGEAVALARCGLEVLERAAFPTAARGLQALLATTLGMALVASKGFASPDALAAFERAEVLLAGVADPAPRFPVLWGLCITHLMRGQLDRALHYSDGMLETGRATPGGGLLIEALWLRADVLFWLGRLDEAEAHLHEALALYRPEHHANAHVFGQNPGVAARVYLMQLHMFRLRPREALACAEECLEFARGLRHPHSLVWAMASGMMVKLLAGDVAGTLASGPETIAYCMKQEHPFWLSAVKMMMGWALAQSGRADEGLRMAREGFALYEMLGTSLIAPVFCALLADCCAAAGETVEAATWVARARKMVVQNNEQLSRPAVALVAGQLLERAGQREKAEASYREALDCARTQGALLREVQAAAMLARVLAEQGRLPEAGAALAPYAAAVMSPDAPEFLRPLREFMAAAAG